MPVALISGLPGHGKTSIMVEELMAEAAKKEPRPIWQAGIEGLRDGLATELVDPTKWNAIDPSQEGTCECGFTMQPDAHGELVRVEGRPPHAHVVPDGAIIFIDEAWKWFGHLQNATRQANPAHVLELAEHRHRGIDFVWTTQGPTQIYPFARTLIDRHRHVVRRWGTQFIEVFTWGEMQEEVKSTTKRELAERVTRTLPKDVRGVYKSASEHTIKAKLPLRLFLLPVLLVALVTVLYFAVTMMKPSQAEESAGEGEQAALAAADLSVRPVLSDADKEAALLAYYEERKPRIAALPGSAPLFDGRSVVSEPGLYCIAGGSGADGNGEQRAAGCTCLTEQGTPYALPRNECEMLARQGGAYDPYKEPRRERGMGERRDRGAGVSPAVTPSSSASGVIEGEQVSGYGDLAVGG